MSTGQPPEFEHMSVAMYAQPPDWEYQPTKAPELPPVIVTDTSTLRPLMPNIDAMTPHQRFALVKSLLARMSKADLERVQTLVDAHVETAE